MTIEPIVYKYALNVKLSQVPAKTPLNATFPSVEDLVISSRKFDKFEDAVQSANKLVSSVATALNIAVEKEQFKMISEINPRFSGKATISQDWGSNEIAKLWIVDDLRTAEQKAKGIRAVGLGQLLEIPGEPVPVS